MPHKEWIINGEQQPSVTDVSGNIAKPWLEDWQRRVGFAEADRITKLSTDVGTAFHDHIETYIQSRVLLPSRLKANKMARVLIDTWLIPNKVEVLETETHLKDNKYMYHGTLDAIAKIGETYWILDWKSSSKIDDTYGLQLSAYANLYSFNKGLWINDGGVVRIDKKTLQPEVRTFNNLDKYFKVFLHALKVWEYTNQRGEWKQ